MKPDRITTGLEISGAKIVRNIGVVRGIVVRSRSVFGQMLGGLQTVFGGNITVYTNMCERARQDAYDIMCEHAEKHGANAIIMARYDTTEIMRGVTEVLCYGTAVVVEEVSS
ncbi:MAG: YbjQ family protein [Alphaproteobacteria bacterium]|nr:YbjQ family protein [Alphaproteobacteria bacterium]